MTMPIRIALMISKNVKNPSLCQSTALILYQYTILCLSAHAECENFTGRPSAALRAVTAPKNVIY